MRKSEANRVWDCGNGKEVEDIGFSRFQTWWLVALHGEMLEVGGSVCLVLNVPNALDIHDIQPLFASNDNKPLDRNMYRYTGSTQTQQKIKSYYKTFTFKYFQ